MFQNMINSKNFIIVIGLSLIAFAFPFLDWLLMAAVIAFAIKPLQKKWLQKKLHLGKTFSVYLLLFLMIAALTPFILSFLSFVSESKLIIEQIKSNGQFESFNGLVSFLYDNFDFLDSFVSKKQALSLSQKAAQELFQPGFNFAKSFFTSMPKFFIGLFFFAAGLFYFMSDSSAIRSFIEKTKLMDRKSIEDWTLIIQKACQSNLYAAFLTGVVQSILISFTALLFGSNFFFTIFFITFFLSQIPLLGTAPVSIGLIIFFYSSGSNNGAIAMLCAGLLAGISDNIVRAWVMSRYDSLHPLAGLVTAIGGLMVIGPVGIFIGPILAMVFHKAMANERLYVDQS